MTGRQTPEPKQLQIGSRVTTCSDINAEKSHPFIPAGSIGVIVRVLESDDAGYRIRFPDGVECNLQRNKVMTLAAYKSLASGEAAARNCRLTDYVVYRCIIGSRAYGLDHENSDTDLRGIFLPPARVHWSMHGVPEQLEDKENEECYWELQKFLVLALKANPNILECLYSPLVLHKTPLIDELLAMRSVFLSKLVYQTYNGYVISQFKKMSARYQQDGTFKAKHAMHLIRLLIAGITLLREKRVLVNVEEHRDDLLAIRQGELDWEAINRKRLALHKEFEIAYTQTELPDQPDFDRADQFLVKARASMFDGV